MLKTSRCGRWLLAKVWDLYMVLVKLRKQYFVQKEGWFVLREVHEALTEAGISYFVDFGTLLGMIREGRFLRHDADLDIGIIGASTDVKDCLNDVLKKAGFRLSVSFWFKGSCVSQSYIYGKVKCDFCFYVQQEPLMKCWLFRRFVEGYEYSSPNEMTAFEFHYTNVNELKALECNGITMMIPSDPESFLVEKYGNDWRIPNKKWRYWLAPRAKQCNEFGQFHYA